MSPFRSHGFVLVTGALFGGSLFAQWLTHTGTPTDFLNAVMENWQSEFLQLIWQVFGLKILLEVGSPQSREGVERLEEKVDGLLRAIGRGDLIRELDNEYPRR